MDSQSYSRDPRVSLPQWAYTWLNLGPLYAALLSAALFSVALCLYVLSTQVRHLIQIRSLYLA